jgi:predicted transcriptional regulator of viral defense system
MAKEIIYTIFADSRTVFRINDIALLLNSTDAFLSQKLNRLVKEGMLLNLRKGIYAKKNYNPAELACILYTPTYISLNYVLARNSVVFQFDSAISNVSYLTREIEVDNQRIEYRKMKDEILLNTAGIVCENNINIATPERAFLDTLYLFGDVYFDNLKALNYDKIMEFLAIYNSKRIENYIKRNFEKNGQ